jgi:hypothetical protein
MGQGFEGLVNKNNDYFGSEKEPNLISCLWAKVSLHQDRGAFWVKEYF